MRFRYLAAAMLFAATATLPAAADELITFTFNSTVLPSSQDDLGFFGPAGASLTGDPVTFVFTVNTSLGILPYGVPAGTFDLNLITYPTYDLSTLNVSATITLNGITVHSAAPPDNVGVSYIEENATGGVPTKLQLFVNSAHVDCGTLTPGACFPYVYPISSSGFVDSSAFGFDVLSFSYSVNPQFPGDPYLSTYVNAALVPPVVTVTEVPEPSSLLLLGTGLAGFAAAFRQRWRSRRR